MAVFNPAIQPGQDNMPDWTKVTHPISDIPADKSAGLRLAALGQTVEGVTSLADDAIKMKLQQDVRSAVEPIREEYTNQLLATRDLIQGNSVVPAVPATDGKGQPLNLLQQDQPQDVPANIKSGLAKVASLQNYLTTGSGGKVAGNEVYYDMRLKDAVTSLRANNPGYVQFIDSEVSKITGMNPANELVRDLQRQITQYQSNKKTEYDKWVDIARGAVGELQNGDKMYNDLVNKGEAGLKDFQNWYATEKFRYESIKQRAALRGDRKANEEDSRERWTQDFTHEAGVAVANNMNTMLTISGAQPMTIGKMMQDAAENPGRYNTKQLVELDNRLQAQMVSTVTQLKARASEIQKDGSGRTTSYNVVMGAQATESIINNVTSAYKLMHDALVGGGPQGPGIAFAIAQQTNAMLADVDGRLMSSPAGDFLAKLNSANNRGGQAAVNFIVPFMAGTDVPDKLKNEFTNSYLKVQVPDAGKPQFTFKDYNNKAVEYEENKQITSNMRARYLNNGLKIVDDITRDGPDWAKENAIRFFFSPEGQGIMPTFNNDRKRIVDGRMVDEPGRQTIWRKLTAPDIVAQIKRLSDSNPEIGRMYTKWITTEAGAGLYYKDLLDLNTLTQDNNLKIIFHDGKDAGEPYIELKDTRSPEGQRVRTPQYGVPQYSEEGTIDLGRSIPNPGQIDRAKASIDRVNQALRGVNNVYKGMATGDASAALLSFMISAQVQLGRNWTGLPKMIMDSIAASQGKGALEEALRNKKKEEK